MEPRQIVWALIVQEGRWDAEDRERFRKHFKTVPGSGVQSLQAFTGRVQLEAIEQMADLDESIRNLETSSTRLGTTLNESIQHLNKSTADLAKVARRLMWVAVLLTVIIACIQLWTSL